MFTELAIKEKNLKRVHKHIINKCNGALNTGLDEFEYDKVVLSWHVFPAQFNIDVANESEYTMIYPDLVAKRTEKKVALFTKRIIDIFGSSFLIVIFTPVFLCIAFCIKLSSKGPVLFKQKRVGLFGKKFKFMKFRTMVIDNDPTIHQISRKTLS